MTQAIDITLKKRITHFENVIRNDRHHTIWWLILDRSDLNREEKDFVLEFTINYVRKTIEKKSDENFFLIHFERFISKEIRHNIRAVYHMKGWQTMDLLH